MNATSLPSKTIAKLTIVKSYQSRLDGENIRLVMYRKEQRGKTRYGIAKLFSDIACTKDYRNPEANELRTFPGNEDSIIDWVSAQEANARYTNIMMELLYSVSTKLTESSAQTQNGAKLWLVTSS